MLRFLHPTEWTLLLILASACFLLLPGFYSNDTTLWLETSGPFFGIGQPWGIYATTKILAAVWPSHGSLVLFNQLVIFSGLALLFRGLKFSKFVGPCTAAAIVLVNPWTILTFIAWRDFTGLGLFLCIAGLLAIQWQQKSAGPKRVLLLTSIFLGFLGCTMLQQFPAVLVLPWTAAMFDLMRTRNHHAHPQIKMIAASTIAIALTGLVGGLYYVIDEHVISRDPATYHQASFNYELANLSSTTGKVLIPESIFPEQDLKELQELLDRPMAHAYFFSLLFRNKADSPFTTLSLEEDRRYQQIRKEIIFRHWEAYLAFRLKQFLSRLQDPGRVTIWHLNVREDHGPIFDMSRLSEPPHSTFLDGMRAMTRVNQKWISAPPAVFIAISTFVFGIGWRVGRIKGVHRLTIGTLLSASLVHYLLMSMFAYHAEYRWMIFSYYTAWLGLFLSVACIVDGSIKWYGQLFRSFKEMILSNFLYGPGRSRIGCSPVFWFTGLASVAVVVLSAAWTRTSGRSHEAIRLAAFVTALLSAMFVILAVSFNNAMAIHPFIYLIMILPALCLATFAFLPAIIARTANFTSPVVAMAILVAFVVSMSNLRYFAVTFPPVTEETSARTPRLESPPAPPALAGAEDRT